MSSDRPLTEDELAEIFALADAVRPWVAEREHEGRRALVLLGIAADTRDGEPQLRFSVVGSCTNVPAFYRSLAEHLVRAAEQHESNGSAGIREGYAIAERFERRRRQ